MQRLKSNIDTRGVEEAMMKLGQEIEYEQQPAKKSQRGRPTKRKCYSPMN
jgi:hypothetical protein